MKTKPPIIHIGGYAVTTSNTPDSVNRVAVVVTITLSGLLGHEGGSPMDRLGLAPCGVYLCRVRYRTRGALLPHLFTLTLTGGLFLWHFPSGNYKNYRSAFSSGALPYEVRKFLPQPSLGRERLPRM